jgi:hypothetical protein
MKDILSATCGVLFMPIPFLVFWVMHLMNANGMAGMVPSLFPGVSFY